MRASRILVLLLLAASAKAADRPNVLFIAVDDLNDWVGCLGGPAKTPNLDRLAHRGTLFANAHCQAPLCNPTRTSLLTGLRPSTTGVYALEPWFRSSESFKDVVTLPQFFAANGYHTVTTGKIYHDAYPPPEGRRDGPEFDVWGFPGSHGPLPEKRFIETPDPLRLIDWGVYPERDEQQGDFKVASYAIDQLKTLPKDRPFFLCVGLRKPHLPCYAPQKWFDLYPEESLTMPPVKADDRNDTPRFSWYLHWKLPEPRLKWLQENHQWRPLVRAYLACISFMDSQVGRLLDALESSGHAGDTIVVLWSDHGWHIGEKGISGKTTLWERSTHVPLIFAGPGVAAEGRCTRPAELLDIYPTLISLCGLPANAKLEGHSLAPQLRDAAAPREWPAITTHGPGNHSIRTEQWRYIHYADGSEELYDRVKDPNEWTNLAGDPSVAPVKRDLARWLPKQSHPPLPGSRSRLIDRNDGAWRWEGVPIDPASQPD